MTDAATTAPMIGPVASPDLHVMTYNIRRRIGHVMRTHPDRWATRRPLLRRILQAEQPTILGVQEALADQAAFVAESLGPDFGGVGRGRNANGRGERSIIFFDRRRLRLTASSQFALSDTPDKPGSRSWGNSVPRVVVSAEFDDLGTGGRVIAFTTHFDHKSPTARTRSAEMVLKLVAEAQSANPDALVIVTGDVNADVNSAVYRHLTESGVLRDSWHAAEQRLTPQWGTFSNYLPLRPGGKRIDLILVGTTVEVERTGINVVRFDGAAASDHDPVQAVVRAVASR
ncbi:endonuclease/exonuclease/phosphatase family protein [Leifsonia sp. Leaf264]|uniref:endonuclease/exonuclease/phosphatase family protein n=1 Tax=Leifsonia sp. Leaf264 TaxID=1736314 RepID=UPI0006FC4719|nr:endonuclease/exonuclease/phosphatase family protein [Leifsonia sp. Leaf264]KQO97640.1 hypothetical protein ASF30_14585 [Leifsonia sp. Leaf264]